ncbi:MAG: hypothetical protein FWB91_11055 [Defluviitaleaceae bacterium]|nr:hypothetical protein [Defluviitaleaceae bacterium]
MKISKEEACNFLVHYQHLAKLLYGVDGILEYIKKVVGMLWNRTGGGWLGTLMPDKKMRQRILEEYVESGLVLNTHGRVYMPAAKRKYGYYVIPVLYGNRFIARFEPEKSDSHIRIKNWWWEKGVAVSNDLIDCAIQTMGHLAACLEKKQGVHENFTDSPGLAFIRNDNMILELPPLALTT